MTPDLEVTVEDNSPNSNSQTDGIRVTAAGQFLPHKSDPDRSEYFFMYRIRIENEGDEPAMLRSRHWVILDANNKREEVVGEGVVGEQPHLAPGEEFEYTSYCPLGTSWGTMEGTYTFVRDDGSTFDAAIGRFFLVPEVDNALVPEL